MFRPIEFGVEMPQLEIPFIDEWLPLTDEDKLIRWEAKDVLIMPIGMMYGCQRQSLLDFFYVCKKRSYRNDKVRMHTALYLNYFEKFFDEDHELLSVYGSIKYMIDSEKSYNKDNLFNDIKKYILSPTIRYKVKCLNRYNYSLNLSTYRNSTNEGLQYTDAHGLILMEISMLFNMIYPLLTHFLYIRNSQDTETDDFLLEMYDHILDLYDVDIYSKLYETSSTNIKRHKNNNPIWEKQDIRGKNVTTHTLYTVENLILNGIVKYVYNNNLVKYNVSIISGSSDWQITNIDYELDYRPLSNIERDADQNSQFDRFENYLTKENEGLYIQNMVNCEYTIKQIESRFGPFTDEEINFYRRELSVHNGITINPFQRDHLVFGLFYKYFGDPMSILSMNGLDYIKLMIAGKRILLASNLQVLPYIFSSKVNKLVNRKKLNKKEKEELRASQYYPYIVQKYQNDKIEDLIEELIATVLSSEFQIIDYVDGPLQPDERVLHGEIIKCSSIAHIILEEMLMFVTLI